MTPKIKSNAKKQRKKQPWASSKISVDSVTPDWAVVMKHISKPPVFSFIYALFHLCPLCCHRNELHQQDSSLSKIMCGEERGA